MNSTKNMGLLVGISLAIFFFFLGNIILFGMYGEAASRNSLILFKTIYFAIVLVILGTIYIMNAELLNTKTEHALVIFSILLISGALATLSGSVKVMQDSETSFGSGAIAQLSQQNEYYTNYAKALTETADAIKSDNLLLQTNLEQLSEKINNKTPIVVETIITLPPETIYVEEETYEDDDYEDDDEEEEEDD